MNSPGRILVRQAIGPEIETVCDILREAATWLTAQGMTMWRDNELVSERIAEDVFEGLFFIAESGHEPAGVIKFQLEDPLFWPDMPTGESAFIHRLAVRRRFAGGEVSTALLQWAVKRTRELKRRFLRLDCEAGRTKLRAVYERFGFRHHSDRSVPPYSVSRYEFEITAD